MFNGVGVNRSSNNILNCPPWILDCKDKEFNKWEFQPVLIECAIYYKLCTRIYACSREKINDDIKNSSTISQQQVRESVKKNPRFLGLCPNSIFLDFPSIFPSFE